MDSREVWKSRLEKRRRRLRYFYRALGLAKPTRIAHVIQCDSRALAESADISRIREGERTIYVA